MTGFSTPSWKNQLKLIGAGLLLCVFFSLTLTSTARADGMAVRSAELVLSDDWYYLHAEFDASLNRALEEALNKGISLNFLVEFELTRHRWYWFDESIASVRQNLRISYHALTRQYQFSSNSGNKTFNTLAEAKDELNHIVDWKVLDRGQLKRGVNYNAAVRMKLDVKQLPKPLQVDVLGSKDWDIASDWYRFTFTP